MNTPTPQAPWLDNPNNVKRLRRLLIGLLALTVLAEFLVDLHPVFALESWFGFHATYGFLACVLMILCAKALGALIKRPDTYYAEDEADE